MRTQFTIVGSLPGLNDYTRACRANRFAGAKMKTAAEVLVSWQLPRVKHQGRVCVSFAWHERDKRRDPDNIAFAKKFLLDAMVARGVIPNDSQRYIAGLSDTFHVDSGNPRVVVTIEEAS